MKKTFSIKESISFGYNTFKNNWKFWVIATLIASTGYGAMSSTSGDTTNDTNNTPEYLQNIDSQTDLTSYVTTNSPLTNVLGTTSSQTKALDKNDALIMGLIIGIIFAIMAALIIPLFILFTAISVIFQMGYKRLLLNAVRGETLSYKTILSEVSVKKAWRLILSSLLALIIVVAGLFLFVIPGIYFALKYIFIPYVTVEEDPGIMNSLKRSSNISDGAKLKLLGYILIFILLYIVGFLALGVGAFVVMIINSLSFAYIYNSLKQQGDGQVQEPLESAPPVSTPLPSA